MRQRHVAARVERHAAAEAVDPVVVSRQDHAQPVLDRCRRQNAEKRGGGSPLALDELSECVPAPGRVEQALEARELAEAIDRFLRTLPERECSIFLRRYWYVDSVQDIAARYALRENTAKSILFRTREKLRRYLAGEGILV